MDKQLAILKLNALGLPLPDELLILAGEAPKEKKEAATSSDKWKEGDAGAPAYDGRKHLWLYSSPQGKDDPNYYDRIPEEWKREAASIEHLRPEHWVPKGAPEELEPEFIKWCLSINPRFDAMMPYKPFFMFCEAARRWNAEGGSIEEFVPGSQEWIDYGLREMSRCAVNRLYGLDRYITIKEDGVSGRRKYKASTPQAMIAYLKTLKVSAIIKKGRHAAISSTFNALNVFDILLSPSYKGALITDDLQTTAKSLFEDKFMSTLTNMPSWFRPEDKHGHIAHKNTERVILQFGKKAASKADKKKNTAEYSIVSGQDPQAVNGMTLSELDIDEAQNVANFSVLLEERRPQQWAEVNGKMRLIRTSYGWGCVCAGTKVWNNKGEFVKIEDLDPADGIVGYGGKCASKEDIIYWQPPSEKPCYRITTNTGRFLECSEDHPILWARKGQFGSRRSAKQRKDSLMFVEAKDIKPSDRIAVIESIPFYGAKRIWEPRFIGWLIGDGYYGGAGVRLSSADKEIQEYVFSRFKAIKEKSHITRDGREYMEIRINGIQDRLRKLGIMGQSKNRKRLPDGIHSYLKKSICELLGGLFDADGSVYCPKPGANSGPNINLTSSCYELIDEVRFLLQKVGVHCNVKRIKCNPATNPKDKNDWYVLYITRTRSLMTFRKSIGFFISEKASKLDRAIAMKRLPDYTSKVGPASSVRGLQFERVVNVEYIGLRPIYNLTAGTTNTYVANGIVTHNTGNAKGKHSKEFDDEYQKVKSQMEQGKDTGGWVALFFDGFCRPGVDQDHYFKEWSRIAQEDNSKTSTSQDRKLIFASRFPLTDEDATAQNTDTILPVHIIKAHRDRITTRLKGRLRHGRFVEEFDMSRKMTPGSEYPYFVKGARFEEDHSGDPELSPVTMLFDREDGWFNNYFQGTDPIQSYTGRSKMASNIIAASANRIITPEGRVIHIPASVCWISMRHPNPSINYKQVKLMGMYYANTGNNERACPELVEWNQGHDYVRFCEGPHMLLGDSIAHNSELPPIYQDGGKHPGLLMTSVSKGHVHADIIRFNDECGHNEYSIQYYAQLATMKQSETADGKIKFGTIDSDRFNDDLVFAKTFSYIRMKMSYDAPSRIGSDQNPLIEERLMFVRDRRTGFGAYQRIPVRPELRMMNA